MFRTLAGMTLIAGAFGACNAFGSGEPDATPPVDGGVMAAESGTDAGTPDDDPDDDPDAGVADAAPLAANDRYVFVTSVSFKGNFGPEGASKAHERCTELASAAGLPGMYVAFLRSDATDLPEGGGYYTTVGERVFETTPAINDEGVTPSVGIRFNEKRNQTGSTATVWVGDRNQRCASWTTSDPNKLGGVGRAHEPAQWRNSDVRSCNEQHRLYCFQR